MAAWLIYMSEQGLCDIDPAKVQALVDAYMQSVIDYGVACCHHTCKNLAFNAKLIQMSSLTPAQKQKFAEILAQATNTDPLYKMDESGQQEQSDDGSGDAQDDANQADILVNGTTQDKSDASNGGKTAFGEDLSESGDAKVADSQSSQDSASASVSNAKTPLSTPADGSITYGT